MDDFAFYFDLGWKHIIGTDALDHQIFILALAANYLVANWKQVLVLVTAFTLGHSATLVLSLYNFFKVNTIWVEFLIPLTTVITAFLNLTLKKLERSHRLNYFLAAVFGLIHGLGFANSIRFMLAKNQSIGWPLFGFNLGLESGQMLLVVAILLASYMLVNKFGLAQRWWAWTLSLIAMIFSVNLCIQRLPF